jgi:hypothetical protein
LWRGAISAMPGVSARLVSCLRQRGPEPETTQCIAQCDGWRRRRSLWRATRILRALHVLRRRDVRTYETSNCMLGALAPHGAQFAKRYEPLLSLVPDRERRAPQALKERQPAEARQLRMIAKNLRQTIKRDAAGKMVHVMHPDIACEPSQRRWQFIVGASIESRFMEAPLAVMSPKRVLELMLNIKEPDGDRLPSARQAEKRRRRLPRLSPLCSARAGGPSASCRSEGDNAARRGRSESART